MNQKMLLGGALGLLAIAMVFIAGTKVGAQPGGCEKIKIKIEVLDSFCSSLVEQVLEECEEVEESQQDACKQIMSLKARMSCEGMTNKSDLLNILKKSC